MSYTIEVSNSATSWGRTRFIQTITDGPMVDVMASEMKVSSKKLVDGTTYYARAKATYLDNDGVNRTTDYCAITSFLYKAIKPAFKNGDVNGDGNVDVSDINVLINVLLGKDNAANYGGRADVNADNMVDIGDINALINIMLSK